MFKEYFYEFCEKHGYIGNIGFDKDTKEYHLIISKGNDNAGAFMNREELNSMNNSQIQNLINILHTGFIDRFEKY